MELCRVISARRNVPGVIDTLEILEETHQKVVELTLDFVNKMWALRWNTHDCALLSPLFSLLRMQPVKPQKERKHNSIGCRCSYLLFPDH